MSAGIEIFGLGCIAVDDLLYVHSYPAADVKTEVHRRERQCGGLTANALIAAARLGANCAYGGTLGDDELSRFARRQLELEGIDLSLVKAAAHAYPIHSTVVVDQQTATRNIFYDLSGVVPRSPEGIDGDTVCSLKALIVDHFCIEAQIVAASIAREKGIPVVADFERNALQGFDTLLDLADHVILADQFAMLLTGCCDPPAATAALWNARRNAVVVTCGQRGSYFAAHDIAGVQHFPAFAVDVVDTTGCGDVFHGAYAAALVEGMRSSEAIRFASATAAIKATRCGGQAGAPTRGEVDHFLQQAQNRTQP